MRYLAAYLLLQLGGNQNVGLADIKKVLSSVGVDVDEEKANKVIKELTGKNIEEVIAEGSKKLASVPCGGGAPAATTSNAPEQSSNTKKEEKKEEPAEESEEEDMGFGLFD